MRARISWFFLAWTVGCQAGSSSSVSDAPSPPTSSGDPRGTEGWWRQVSARLADGERTFVDADHGFATSLPAHGLMAHFDATGATIHAGQTTWVVGNARLGRASSVDVTTLGAPRLGACVDGMREPDGACVRRLERAGDGLTEWWVNRPEGLEQGWTIEGAPAGTGSIAIDLPVDGGDVEVRDDVAWIGLGGPQALSVSEVRAWDADGVPLDAWFEAVAGGLRVSVDDAGARFPITVDPVYQSAAWQVSGEPALSDFADTIIPIRDANGDGFADVMVRGTANSERRFYIYYGSASGLPTFADQILVGATGIQYGISAAGVGDLNSDGYADVAVGARGGVGAVYVYLGRSTGLPSAASVTLTGTIAVNAFGSVVSGAGDVHGDGYDDLIVAEPGYNNGTGQITVFRGNASGVSTTGQTPVVGDVNASIGFATVIAPAGDVNNDGYDDIAVGAPFFDQQGAPGQGRTYVYRGATTGLSASRSTVLAPGVASAHFGSSIAAAGDTNGDGYGDLWVSSPDYSAGVGMISLFRGTATAISTAATRTWTGTASAPLGGAMANVGDVNGDGLGDTVFGAPAGASGAGLVYVLHGTATGPAASYSATIAAPDTAGGFGAVVAGVGDTNGDGKADAVVASRSSSSVELWTYTGSATGFAGGTHAALTSPTGSSLGYAVAFAGDVNGDGYDDAVIGAPTRHSSRGEVLCFLGSATGLPTTASSSLRGPVPGSRFGASVSGAGDVNGDGRPDVVVGAPSAASGDGQAFLYLGTATGVSATSSRTLTGEAGAGAFGTSVASAGDVNGDGYADVLVAAPALSANAGKVYVYLGSASGLAGTAGWSYAGTVASQSLGQRVAGAGDVDGDGYSDVVIGAPGPASTEGTALVFQGGASGLGASPARTLTGESVGDRFGATVAVLGDTNGDGYADVAVGAPSHAASSGRVYVYRGSAAGLTATPAATLSGAARDLTFGDGLAPGGDINGDGRRDLIVGDSGYESQAGRVFVFMSTPGGFYAKGYSFLPGTGSGFGGVLGGGGDADGDGYDDVLVGAPTRGALDQGAAGVQYAGVAYLYRGYAGDADHDGFSDSVDCDDSNAAAHPGGTEVCDPYDGDEDCNGLSDDADPGLSLATRLTWYPDADGDTYGASSGSVVQCNAPVGYVADHTDCDDTASLIRPGGQEVCDAANADEDCDGLTDNADSSATPATKTTFYVDTDGDGYGAAVTGRFCDQPAGYAPNNTDCNDAASGINPGAQEVCDAANVDEDCDFKSDDADPSVSAATFNTFFRDADLDGYGGSGTTARCDVGSGASLTSDDCNDSAGTIHPNGQEVCDLANVDEDCDGLSDNADTSASDATRTTYYTDADNDGYGSPASPVRLCDITAGVSSDNTDCNDTTATISPFASEVCDPANADEDCDGLSDNNDPTATAASKTTFYLDSDGDTYGGNTSAKFCDKPAGYSATKDDCNDSAAAINPGAQEVCDPADVDEDCDTLVDDADSSVSEASKLTFYVDVDADGYGGSTVVKACAKPSNAIATSTDCNDAVSAIHPGAQEVCDPANADEDCDGLADDADSSVSLATRTTFYLDGDGDGYGSSSTTLACDLPAGASANHTDCNDALSAINPGAAEVCDAANVDEDCDALADDADSSASDASRTTFLVDADHDGFGGVTTVRACDPATGRTLTSGDCDDAAVAINPSGQEICDALNADEDCDGQADDADSSVSAATRTTFYADVDGDGYGVGTPTLLCDARAGYGSRSGDCNDAVAGVNPGATEVCDPSDVDEDCDGTADDADPSTSVASKTAYYGDADGDGYGGGAATMSCSPVPGKVTVATDCNDALAAVHPGAQEVCDLTDVDEDCDGAADDADPSVLAATKSTFHPDVDHDGYGSALLSSQRCDATGGQVVDGTDCDDAVPSTYPSATEGIADGVDSSCDSQELCYADADHDGARAATTVVSADLDCSDVGEAATTAPLDCDDMDASTGPGATEVVGDGVDQDCDGHERCYVDVDGDGYRIDALDTVVSADADCADVGEALATDPIGDCDDNSTAYHPNAPETDCADPADYNCDGFTGYADNDGDGWPACDDCDDNRNDVRPDAIEVAGDGLDGNCDGVDLCYIDQDGDGYRVDATNTITGTTPGCNGAGEATRDAPAGDCRDTLASIHPDAVELVGDAVDQDCDGREVCYVDADGDGARPDATAQVLSLDADCTDLGEALATAALNDCDDHDASIRPGKVDRTGDGVDSDCDGLERCFVDVDGDGYRPDLVKSVASADTDCTDPGEALSTALAGDCDDTQVAFHPGAPELDCADPHDYNCDNSVAYVDNDHDTYAACVECNDANAAVHPGATELPGDRVDSNCDALELCFVDADNDGARPDATSTVSSTRVACDGAGEAVATDPTTDCDDADSLVGPFAAERPADGVDQDCDGLEDCYADVDGDGYRPDDVTFVSSLDLDCTDAGEATAALPPGDCDDDSSAYHPGASETQCGDGEDYNCDGATGYTDHDGDGFGACDECDDGDVDVNPDATEVCNGVDDNCDGEIDERSAADAGLWYADADGDGYTSNQTSIVACAPPDGYAAASSAADCDDASADVHPGATDIADDGIDQDCVGGDLTTDSPGDTDTTGGAGGDTDTGPDDEGCQCDHGGAPRVGPWVFALAAGLLRRRRLRAGRRQ